MQPFTAQPAGLLWTWWYGDELPLLPPIDCTVTVGEDDQTVAQITGLSCEEVRTRRDQGQCPYLARSVTAVVGYGWSAATRSEFGSPPVAFTIPESVRYLYDFATLPEWRGQGIYSRLLQAIIRHESPHVTQFWILHQWTNHASRRGIAKAGFYVAGEIYWRDARSLALRPGDDDYRTVAGSKLLGLPLLKLVIPP